MLPPVAAVSSASLAAPQREVATVAEALSTMTTTPDGTVALSLAVSAGVEGKLNMLLINAREQMLNSLFDVIDALSQSLAVQQEAGESNAAYALRLADTITELPAKQMASVQQQLTAQGQSAPLSLIAAALHDPASPQAAQLVAYLEVVRYKDKDLATKSVVASYGQNDGNTESESAPEAAPVRAATTQAPTTPGAATLPQGQTLPQAATAPGTATPSTAASQLPEEVEPPLAAIIPEVIQEAVEQTSPQQATNTTAVPASNQPATARASTAADQTAETVATAVVSEAVETAVEATTSPVDEAVPRAILQIRSDIKEGLKAVFDRLVEATGTELLQTMAEAEPLADKAIAQALIADMMDGTELPELAMPDIQTATEKAASTISPLATTLASETAADEPATTTAQQPLVTPEAAEEAARPQVATTPSAYVIGYVTTPYAPAEDVVEEKDPMRIDRVDAVDDDEHEEPGKQQHQQHAQSDDEPESPAEEALDMLGGEPEASSAAAEAPQQGRSTLLALPQPAPVEPLPNPGYNLYERMGA